MGVKLELVPVGSAFCNVFGRREREKKCDGVQVFFSWPTKMREECDFGFVWLQMRKEKRKEMNSSKEMRKKRKRNQFSYVCMFGHRERRGKKREKNAFLFPLFGLP